MAMTTEARAHLPYDNGQIRRQKFAPKMPSQTARQQKVAFEVMGHTVRLDTSQVESSQVGKRSQLWNQHQTASAHNSFSVEPCLTLSTSQEISAIMV